MFRTMSQDLSEETRAEYVFTWRIENYSMCYRKHKEAIMSAIFTPSNFGGSKWYMTLFPSGRKTKGTISCILNRSDEDLGVEEISVAFIIEVTNGNGYVLATRGNDFSNYEFQRGMSLGYDDILESCEENTIIIRCRMVNTFLSGCEAITEVEIDRYSFTWAIDFNDCLAESETRKFSFSKSSQYEIALTSGNDQIEIKICKLNENTAPRIMDGKISLLNQRGESILSQKAKHLFGESDGSETWNYPYFISRIELDNNKKNYLKNGAFSLFCEFIEANGIESSRILSSNCCFTTQMNNIINFHDDLKNMFSNMKYSDIRLRVGNAILPAHRNFLSARSPVFSAMFEQDMIENRSGIVDIPDVDVETLKYFLEFVYTGRIHVPDYKSALQLLMTAEKYQVLSLKEMCSEYLLEAPSVENVGEILVAADMLNLKQLKKCTLDYIAKHITEISNSCKLLEFIEKNATLSKEIFTYFAAHFELKPKTN